MIRMRVHVAAIHPFSSIHPSSTSTFHHLPPLPLGYCLSRANQIIPGVPFRPCVKSFVQWEFFSFFLRRDEGDEEEKRRGGGSGEVVGIIGIIGGSMRFGKIFIRRRRKPGCCNFSRIILSVFTSLYCHGFVRISEINFILLFLEFCIYFDVRVKSWKILEQKF